MAIIGARQNEHGQQRQGTFHRMATVIDIASRRVAGYAMADHLRTGLVADALGNAVAARDPEAGVIFHSDYAEDGVKPGNHGLAWSAVAC